MAMAQAGVSSDAPPCVLLIEDEIALRTLVAEELRELGITVIEAHSADEARAYFAAGEVPDLVFSDIRLPGSMNGVDFARHIRQDHPSVPVILTSGYAGADRLGDVAHFLRKPYRIAAAIALMFQELGLPPPSG